VVVRGGLSQSGVSERPSVGGRSSAIDTSEHLLDQHECRSARFGGITNQASHRRGHWFEPSIAHQHKQVSDQPLRYSCKRLTRQNSDLLDSSGEVNGERAAPTSEDSIGSQPKVSAIADSSRAGAPPVGRRSRRNGTLSLLTVRDQRNRRGEGDQRYLAGSWFAIGSGCARLRNPLGEGDQGRACTGRIRSA